MIHCSPSPLTIATLAFATLLGLTQAGGAQSVFHHEDWARVLEGFVDDVGLVDYRALAQSRQDLDSYLSRIRTTGPQTHPELFPTRDHQLAYYLNAYNALVFQGVLNLGPDTASVWGAGTGYRFFVSMKVEIEGRTTNLKKLEDKTIRDGFQDPRIHAALNCASLGCPRLPREPFLGETLDTQLDRAMTEFVESPRHCLVSREEKTVQLSKIFKWFRKDFTGGNRGDEPLVAYVNRYRQNQGSIPTHFKVRFLPYDKGLNAQEERTHQGE